MNESGTAQIAPPPRLAAKMPTATIARMWSIPLMGCERPWMKPDVDPTSVCANADHVRRGKQTAKKMRM
jgi:hypothetical protein